MIGWYVHHQGRGHLARMEAVAAHLTTPVTGLSTLPAPEGWAHRWVQLPRDDDPMPGPADDVDANGVLHWAPLRHRGVGERAATITAWLARARPRLVVTDVSVETALLVRLCGVPVVVVTLPGDRTDRAHRAAHDLAAGLLAPWPEGSHDAAWPAAWRAKARFVGGLSRFDGAPRAVPSLGRSTRRAVVLWGAGGRETTDAALESARAATPGWDWSVFSPEHPSPDLWGDLCSADVVVTHAGQNAVADVAAARAPAVVVAQPRPFDEQVATAAAVARLRIAEGHPAWPETAQWPDLLERAVRRGGDGWARWSTGRGAQDAAAWLDDLAGEPEPAGGSLP